jgi:four helix bundle protein
MATIHRFEDIESWKEARKLTAQLYRVCRKRPLSDDFGLCDQIRRAGVSIMANIAEGFGRGGTREFLQFLSTARGSTTELKSHFYIMLDAEYIDQPTFDDLYAKADRIETLITGFMNYLQKTDVKGRKFK